MKKAVVQETRAPSIADHLASVRGINLERDQKFESTSLQQRVCELSVPKRRTDRRERPVKLGGRAFDVLLAPIEARGAVIDCFGVASIPDCCCMLRSPQLPLPCTISGTTTENCCHSTARDAMFRSYRVAFLSDATATYDYPDRGFGAMPNADVHHATLVG